MPDVRVPLTSPEEIEVAQIVTGRIRGVHIVQFGPENRIETSLTFPESRIPCVHDEVIRISAELSASNHRHLWRPARRIAARIWEERCRLLMVAASERHDIAKADRAAWEAPEPNQG